MKKIVVLIFLTLIITLFLSAGLSAQESDVVFIDGWVDIKDSSGDIYELFIGDRVLHGDTVITGDDGVAELEPENGSRIIVQPDTVFSIKETDVNGKKQSVVSTTLGQVSFKFNRMTNEPLISTPSAVMGVRGTEFTVYAGADGSSLVAVSSGAVEVSSLGKSVMLEKDEGVEIQAGKAPGEKFPVLGGKLDYESWNTARIDEMTANPVSALAGLEDQLKKLADDMDIWVNDYEANKEKLQQLRDEMKALIKEGKVDEGNIMNKEVVQPFEFTTSRLVLNYRYYALSALSFRQHVLGGFYVRMKTAYINDSKNPFYTDFISKYKNVINTYENRIQPYLVAADY